MTTRALLVAALVAAASACTQKPPAAEESGVVTLGWFEGEIDATAGTFTIRPASAPAQAGLASGRLVVPEGASTLGISNPRTGAGSPTKVTGGCGGGADSLESTVTVTLNYPTPQFVGAIYAEITSLDLVTGYTSCNSSPAPTGLSAQYGLWSFGTVRPGAPTSPKPWKFGFPSGAGRSRFEGRIVGVLGTTLPIIGSLLRPENPGATRSPTIVYTRGAMAYVARGGEIVYVGLDGTATGTTIGLPAGDMGRSLAFQPGADASADLLWFTTNSYVGVVYQGTAYSVATATPIDPGNPDGLGSIVVDPTTQDRAWFIAQYANSYGAWSGWFRSIQFNPSTKALALGTPTVFPWGYPPYGIAIAPPRSASSSTDPYWIYVTGNDAIPIPGLFFFSAYDFSGNLKREFSSLAAYPDDCHVPFTPIVGPGNVLWFAAYRDIGYPGPNVYSYRYSFCQYDPAADTFTVIPLATFADYNGAAGAAAVGPAVGPGGSGSVVWGIDIRPDLGLQYVRQLVGTADAQFAVELATSVGWGWEPFSIASSPAVTVGGTDYPAYLWVTTANGILRLQP